MSPQLRPIVKITQGMPTSDGAGVKLTRLLGTPDLRVLDPFLMLDKFHSDNPGDYLAGFPPHPHRGFETVTYMVEGRMRHQDNKGHEGVIEPGGVQWMTAARGIVHSEMPEQEDGLMSGFQLWVNLPKAEKMKDPGYQEYDEAQVPSDTREGVVAKIVTGQTSTGVKGPVTDVTVDPLYAELRMEPGAVFEEPIPDAKTAFLAVHTGDVEAGGMKLKEAQLGVFGRGDAIRIKAGPEGARLMLAAGKPIGEPIVWGGPFVMTTEGEVRQAMLDYQQGRF
ncbi:MAG: quercetin 2,3-dioxygenase [Oceanicaulis sp.]|jgi:redox-sensitive bicupin YhaK (pirin superfamily)|uniref:pirin family protein n=1 Tax=Oceanicaulis TaxID=153232 RepID=UPI000C09EC56|nr:MULTISPECIES: pirin family protein [Oceanicaulis]MAP47852.1 quercetin 2,3-dioxygenase [Oceanicaulis sp.]VXC75934.1 Pirin-like protein CC_0481 [Oceanicaulis sp. 350]|tara:strand:+ start:3022 stop:3858 length:837 start_codon:yes stop_codon:yes gene_type:complete